MFKSFKSTMPDKTRERILLEARELEAKGERDAANRLRNTIPVYPKLANELKKIVGVQMLNEDQAQVQNNVKQRKATQKNSQDKLAIGYLLPLKNISIKISIL